MVGKDQITQHKDSCIQPASLLPQPDVASTTAVEKAWFCEFLRQREHWIKKKEPNREVVQGALINYCCSVPSAKPLKKGR